MNQQQRKKWNKEIEYARSNLWLDEEKADPFYRLLLQVDWYIKQLEKRLNIKEPASLFKEKNEPTQ